MKKFLVGVASIAGILFGLFTPIYAWAVTPMVAVGGSHTCYLSSAGAVMCWGNNFVGELGNGTISPRIFPGPQGIPTPALVYGLSSGVVSIAAGSAHTCALTNVGSVLCWGLNLNGELGNGSTADAVALPVVVSGLTSGVVAIAAGDEHTCALTSAGAVLCWGLTKAGQLGNVPAAPPYNSYTPLAVVGLPSGVVAISVSFSTDCTLTNTGAVYCWPGANGNWGDGYYGPTKILGLSSDVTSISADSHSCALTSAGAVMCWGSNGTGELGNGTTNNLNYNPPSVVSGLNSGVASISTGSSQTCALTRVGAIMCWGLTYKPYITNVNPVYSTTPVAMSGFPSGIVGISVGPRHACALTNAGAVPAGAVPVVCWGHNDVGQLGNGTFTDSTTTPVAVSSPSTATAPDAPTIGTATPGNGTANIAFTAPTNTGSSAVTGYTATCTPGNISATGTSSPITVTGLTNGVTYSCSVTASNSARMGTASSTVSVTPAALSLTLATGWNLVGNSVNATMSVTTTFNDVSKVNSVWKWIPSTSKWAFYAPSLAAQSLTDYAFSKGYDVLTTINGGEAFWVNAQTAFTTPLPSGAAITSTSFQTLPSGWHLISIGSTRTPSGFNMDMSMTPPTAGVVPKNITTLWMWDNAQSKWYFYAPTLEAQGGTALSDYISSHGYLDFTAANKTLGAGVGFWVNKP